MNLKSLFLKEFLNVEFRIEPMGHGMSYRTYDRVMTEKNSYILMNVPTHKPLEDGQSAIEGVIKPFINVHAYLKNIGIKVPDIIAIDEVKGLVLLEDLGDTTFYDAFHGNVPNRELYIQAVDYLVSLYKAKPMEGVEHYNVDLATIRGEFFLDDYLPAVTGQESTSEQCTELNEILAEIYEVVANVHWGTILWDYHSPNLMVPRKEGDFTGVLDFQDAKYGPLSYDLASLLYDARFTFPKDEREYLFNYFVKQSGIKDVQAFRDSFEMAGLLRNLGVLGRFARAAYRDHKPEFLPKIAILWPYIDEVLENPKSARLKAFLDKHMPSKRLLIA